MVHIRKIYDHIFLNQQAIPVRQGESDRGAGFGFKLIAVTQNIALSGFPDFGVLNHDYRSSSQLFDVHP
jgi:hypothetical protein